MPVIDLIVAGDVVYNNVHLNTHPSAEEFFDRMLELHPTKLIPGALWGSATSLLSRSSGKSVSSI